jgi:nucleotide-binding universal stress UspA family protein
MLGEMIDESSTRKRLAIEHVLLPLDGSDLALAAVPTAHAIAQRFGAHLTTLSVASDPGGAETLRVQVLEALVGHEGIDVEVVVAPDPAAAIAGRVDELGSAVVCMSSRGRGRVAGAVFGSVARSVLRSTTGPMVVVGPQADRPGYVVGRPPRRPSRWPAPLSAGRIVACVDGSADSEAVLPVAAGWAAALGAGVTVLTVAHDAPPDLDGRRPNRLGPGEPELYVDDVAQRWREAIPDIIGEVAYDPIGVASGVAANLATRSVAMIAVSTRARSGADRVRGGATAAEIVAISTAPALIVGPSPSSARPGGEGS